MRKMVKRLLKKYKYPPEDYDFAISTVINQCDHWTDNVELQKEEKFYKFISQPELSMVAESPVSYEEKNDRGIINAIRLDRLLHRVCNKAPAL